MSLTATPSWGPELSGAWGTAQLNAFVKSQTNAVVGTMGTSDMAAGAVTPAKVTPGAYIYAIPNHVGAMVFTLTLSPALGALTDGAQCWGRMPVGITGAATLNVNGLGAKKWMTATGLDFANGQLRSGQSFHCIYNSSADAAVGAWILLSVDGQPFLNNFQSAVSTNVANAFSATFAPTVPALVDGTRVRWRVPATNTGASTFAPDILTAKAIRKNYNQPLVGGELIAGLMVEMVYCSTSDQWHLVSNAPGPYPARGTFRNLVITRPSITQVTITAEDVALSVTTAATPGAAAEGMATLLVTSVNVTAAITAAGANGLDTGAEANVRYYIYVIHNPTTATTAALLSVSRTNPTLPSGYTYYARVGMVVNSSGDFRDFIQRDRRVYTTEVSSAALTAATWVALDFTGSVPDDVVSVFGYAGNTDANPARITLSNTSGAGLGMQQIVVGNSAGAGAGTVAMRASGNFETYYNYSGAALYARSEAGTAFLVLTGYTW